MTKINVIMHYPNDESAVVYIMEATTQTYLKSIIKVFDKSNLTIIEKRELLDKKASSL